MIHLFYHPKYIHLKENKESDDIFTYLQYNLRQIRLNVESLFTF
jgi:hypothetical protein